MFEYVYFIVKGVWTEEHGISENNLFFQSAFRISDILLIITPLFCSALALGLPSVHSRAAVCGDSGQSAYGVSRI